MIYSKGLRCLPYFHRGHLSSLIFYCLVFSSLALIEQQVLNHFYQTDPLSFFVKVLPLNFFRWGYTGSGHSRSPQRRPRGAGRQDVVRRDLGRSCRPGCLSRAWVGSPSWGCRLCHKLPRLRVVIPCHVLDSFDMTGGGVLIFLPFH